MDGSRGPSRIGTYTITCTIRKRKWERERAREREVDHSVHRRRMYVPTCSYNTFVCLFWRVTSRPAALARVCSRLSLSLWRFIGKETAERSWRSDGRVDGLDEDLRRSSLSSRSVSRPSMYCRLCLVVFLKKKIRKSKDGTNLSTFETGTQPTLWNYDGTYHKSSIYLVHAFCWKMFFIIMQSRSFYCQ